MVAGTVIQTDFLLYSAIVRHILSDRAFVNSLCYKEGNFFFSLYKFLVQNSKYFWLNN